MWYKAYSVGRAALYALVLYVCLWWMPVIGPIVAGYVVGRKAGSPWKGVVASLSPLLAYIALQTLMTAGVIILPADSSPYASSIAGTITPPLTSYFTVTADRFLFYLHNFTAFVKDAPSSFAILMVFAYVGGAISEIRRMEMNYIRLATMRRRPDKVRVAKAPAPKPVTRPATPPRAGKRPSRVSAPQRTQRAPKPAVAARPPARPVPHPEVYREDIRTLGKKRMPPLVKKALKERRRRTWDRL